MKSNSLLALGCLIKRNMKLYFKDKLLVIFSLLAPLIILMLYVLFLSKMQVDAVKTMIENSGVQLADKQVRAVINNWMISGVLGVSCITVALNANQIMVRDRSRGNINDVLASPVKKWIIYASYIISTCLITLGICACVLAVSLAYLGATGGLYLSFGDFLAIVGVMILSVISSSFFMVLLYGFIKSQGALAPMSGIFSAAIGFLIGAYIPTSMLPKTIQYLTCFIPGSYSASLFRDYLLRGPMQMLVKAQVPENLISSISQQYSIHMDFFGRTISPAWMVFALLLSIILFGSLILIFYSSKRTNFFTYARTKIKKIKPKGKKK